ncbi:hypothetical protein BATDEDRAFT_23169 [Batrachochytrium dendrobatidis JAM81]|uniref:Uncharacterized protein n=1 Tax=Batrachochytrium dendrobatidis (strain JAM81 / FGSC 10211) TaxID=684364 RepID=F4NWX9_BATDJ|nr:uncharacterized protein BATDEDRAFT_23169 [Batrachochytrium dendrobatidis JAM81]EGF82568.1 hypothetical protein BATDEDRAFT_23169 [Batrachochytrium dendrobatidis JAM81]|eukprot:XP_006676715.1 hypothetical protein BATDEDRAFT_23169 [Batrachochytrium dendrobatidis JAM81]
MRATDVVFLSAMSAIASAAVITSNAETRSSHLSKRSPGKYWTDIFEKGNLKGISLDSESDYQKRQRQKQIKKEYKDLKRAAQKSKDKRREVCWEYLKSLSHTSAKSGTLSSSGPSRQNSRASNHSGKSRASNHSRKSQASNRSTESGDSIQSVKGQNISEEADEEDEEEEEEEQEEEEEEEELTKDLKEQCEKAKKERKRLKLMIMEFEAKHGLTPTVEYKKIETK